MSTLDALAEDWRDGAAHALRIAMLSKAEGAADEGRYLSGELSQMESAEIVAGAFIAAATDDAHALDWATVNALYDAVDTTDWIAVAAEILETMA